MIQFLTLHNRQRPRFPQTTGGACPDAVNVLREERGSALLEFALTLPLLVVFVVGIYDFGGAFNQKQKIEQAAHEGAIVAAAQPMSDIVVNSASATGPTNPDSLQVVVSAIVKSLTDSGVLPNGNQGTCRAPFTPSGQIGLTWTYPISGCSGSGDQLSITINRGWVCTSGPACTSAPVAVGTKITVANPYHWRFNSAIQLLFAGANYSPIMTLTENAEVQNQM